MSDLVELVARAQYAANCWWRIVEDNDDGLGRYKAGHGEDRFRAIEWEQLSEDERKELLDASRAALDAIIAAGKCIDDDWKPIDTAPRVENYPFLVLLPGNDVAPFIVLQVSIFEGRLYPDARDACIDWEYGITAATHWKRCPAPPKPTGAAA